MKQLAAAVRLYSKFKDSILREVENRFFSGFQLSFSSKSEHLLEFHGGTTAFSEYKESCLFNKVDANTKFDLASLSKALFTTPLIYSLFEKKSIAESTLLSSFFPAIKREITIKSMLNHTSGLPSYIPFYKEIESTLFIEERKSETVRKISEISEVFPPVYSDLNFILLGFILEIIFKQNLAEIWDDFLVENKIPKRLDFAPSGITENVASTMYSEVRKNPVCGFVEDENCYFYGHLAGHAGLFGSAESVVGYLNLLMEQPFFEKWFLALDGAGFDRPEGNSSNYGTKAKSYQRGHLGFTGTAFLMDIKSKSVTAFLTNRTHPYPEKPDWRNRIKELRQLVFDGTLNL